MSRPRHLRLFRLAETLVTRSVCYSGGKHPFCVLSGVKSHETKVESRLVEVLSESRPLCLGVQSVEARARFNAIRDAVITILSRVLRSNTQIIPTSTSHIKIPILISGAGCHRGSLSILDISTEPVEFTRSSGDSLGGHRLAEAMAMYF